jgi:HlyD family secretion protein
MMYRTTGNEKTTKPLARRGTLVAIAALVSIGGIVSYNLWRDRSTPAQVTQTPAVTAPEIKTVTALGRLEPKGEVIKLSAPTSSQESRIDRLLVEEGDRVKAGQVIAILDSRDRLQAAFKRAQEDVRAAQAQLAITKAGAKRGEIEAQKAEIARLEAERQGDIASQQANVDRLEAERQNAETEYRRYESLYQEGATSASERDSKLLTLQTAQKSLQEALAVLNRTQTTTPKELNQARATLERIAEVRPVDVDAAKVEVDRAIADVERAKAELNQAYVRSPQNGMILHIYTRSGEVVSEDGIADIGQTDRMYAVAEVYESDVSKVKVGQKVTITSDSISDRLQGTVERVGAQVRRQNAINTDPSENIDGRIVEVHIVLDPASSQKASKYTNLQVTAAIALNKSTFKVQSSKFKVQNLYNAVQ